MLAFNFVRRTRVDALDDMRLRTSSFSFVAFVATACLVPAAAAQVPSSAKPTVLVDTSAEPVAEGKFEPTWESLAQYETPEWFRDAKFGLWAHWGPQCEPERGDWYAREMYSEGSGRYRFHVERYGHPSKSGFKDVIREFEAENWDPEKLMDLYQRAGAKYFFALANHHDNFDNYDSKYQPWNSVNMGPKKDLIAGWAAAARARGMKFGVSNHAAHAWSWYEPSQGADSNGPLAGVPYDGTLTRAAGKGTWWEGFVPQDLYAQAHEPAPGFENLGSIHGRWNWGNGVTTPSQAYCQKFYNRTADLINKYEPDLLYFDDTALPLWPVSDAGMQLAAHFYNSNEARSGDNGVLFGKVLADDQKKCMSWDIERGSSNQIEPYPWQTCTCIGSWHYDRGIYEGRRYKTAKDVIHMLVDIVSKNGNLLLSVPLRGDGSLDSEEVAIVEGIAAWMQSNAEAIHGTRPWKVYGEGPQMASAAPIRAQGFNEGRGKPFTAEDIRFTSKGNVIYAIVMAAPAAEIKIKSLGAKAEHLESPVASLALLAGTPRSSGRKMTKRWSSSRCAKPPVNMPSSSKSRPNEISAGKARCSASRSSSPDRRAIPSELPLDPVSLTNCIGLGFQGRRLWFQMVPSVRSRGELIELPRSY
jgi:alpha-L-fucosidase